MQTLHSRLIACAVDVMCVSVPCREHVFFFSSLFSSLDAVSLQVQGEEVSNGSSNDGDGGAGVNQLPSPEKSD